MRYTNKTNKLSYTLFRAQLSRANFLRRALTCVLATPVLFSGAAIAGIYPVVIPDASNAGVGDNLAPRLDRSNTCVKEGSLDLLESIQGRSSVPAVDGGRLSILPGAVSTIRNSLEANSRTDLEANLTELERQLTDEIGNRLVAVSRIPNSPSDVRSAISSTNRFINSLNSQQLALASQSPTFLSLLQLLQNASKMLNSGINIGCSEGVGDFGLLGLQPVPVPPRAPQEPAVPPLPPEQTTAPIPPVEPAVQEPIRGLW